MTYTVFSCDMWGHVPADCCSYDCPCVITDEEDGTSTHDENRCECREDMNDRFRVGRISASDSAEIVNALHVAGLLSDAGKEACHVDDYNCMGECLSVLDTEGRLVFYLESEDEES